MSGAIDPSASFIEKWRSRWPEWRVAEAFIPPGQRQLAAAWLALLQELTDAAWAGGDATPGLAKLAWWQEELQGWAKGARRHPLGSVLQRQPAPWTELALALQALPSTREGDADEVRPQLGGLSDAIAACDFVLFGAAGQDRAPGAATDVALAGLLAERALLTAGRGDATRLLEQWPAADSAPRVRRIQAALAASRLRSLAAGRGGHPLVAWRVLPLSWRAARGR